MIPSASSSAAGTGDLHQRKKTVAASSSSKTSGSVAASRERRARRAAGRATGEVIPGSNGHNPRIKRDGGSQMGLSFCARVSILLVGVLLTFLFLLWGGAVYRVSTSESTSEGDITNDGFAVGRDSKKKYEPNLELGGLTKRLRKEKKRKVKSVTSGGGGSTVLNDLYSSESLKLNPWLGWQPPLTPAPDKFSWRKCFVADPTSDGSDLPLTCRESPSEFGEAPPVTENWIPDVTMVRKMYLHGKDAKGHPFPPPLDPVLCENIGVRGGKSDSNKDALIQTGIKGQPLGKTTVGGGTTGRPERPAPRLMCLVYTMADAHASRIRGMRDTWAGGCDGFLAFSTVSDPRLPAISLKHDGPEAYDNMWQKIRSIWRFVGTHYLEQFDYFFIGGDDLFVMPQNLKEVLAGLEGDPTTATHFAGRRFDAGGHDYFNSGGAGYALSQATLRKFLEHIDDAKHCSAKAHTSTEDVMIARCLRHLGINFEDTRDDRGRERFHPFAPGTHLLWAPPAKGKPSDWYQEYNREWGLLEGADCCAPDSVSFHYIKKASMVRHMQALLYFCEKQ